MMCDFYAGKYGFRQMSRSEIEELEVGDEIAICIKWDPPRVAEFIPAKVVRPMFWNSDADEPGWEVETNNGFVDVYSIYEVTEI